MTTEADVLEEQAREERRRQRIAAAEATQLERERAMYGGKTIAELIAEKAARWETAAGAAATTQIDQDPGPCDICGVTAVRDRVGLWFHPHDFARHARVDAATRPAPPAKPVRVTLDPKASKEPPSGANTLWWEKGE